MKTLAKLFLTTEILFLIFIFFTTSPFFKEKLVFDFTKDKEITLNDNGLSFKIKTSERKVGQILEQNKIKVSSEDQIFPEEDLEIFAGATIFIKRPASVEISVDGKKIQKVSFAENISELLSENDISMSHLDVSEPKIQTRLRNNLKITITRIQTEEVTEKEEIDFPKNQKRDNSVNWGEKVVTQKGEKGERETVFKITYKDGREVEKIKIKSKIIKEPKPEIVTLGTKILIGKNDSGVASWYGTDPESCSSRDFPAGTWLKITNKINGKQAFARVEGYGPQAGTGKIIDLSKEVFKKIAPLGQGVTRVKVEEILNKNFNPNLNN